MNYFASLQQKAAEAAKSYITYQKESDNEESYEDEDDSDEEME